MVSARTAPFAIDGRVRQARIDRVRRASGLRSTPGGAGTLTLETRQTMPRTVAFWLSALLCSSVPTGAATASPPDSASPPDKVLSSIELSRPFAARPGWRFTATQGPASADPLGDGTDIAPGAIRLCVTPDAGRTCRPDLDTLLASSGQEDLFSQPHFLDDVRIVHPRPDLPLLLVRVASIHSGDGDQRVATVALAYDRASDVFVPSYRRQTGRNNDQEIRYVETGPLQGAIVAVEPTGDAPFGFWIAISRIGPDDRYAQVLRYRSATPYGDGNPLAVIDSEMPNILQRLGLWHPGATLPLPAGPCPKPRLVGRELWCSDRPAVR